MNSNKPTKRSQTVSLVLGSGGARGLAHIGVIKWLEEHEFEIRSIAGSSIGSLIGGVYAAGKLDQLEQWLLSLDEMSIASLLDPTWRSAGVFKGDKIVSTLITLLEDIQIENLSIPFTAVAVDIVTEKEVWINSGSLFDAVRASASLPLFFTPVEHNGGLLIDGGVLNPVPIAPVFNDNNDLTIAVNLGGVAQKENIDHKENIHGSKDESSFINDVNNFLENYSTEERSRSEFDWGFWDIADKAFDTMQNNIASLKLALFPPDVEIIIARNSCETFDFSKAEEMILLGYERCRTALAPQHIQDSE